MCAYVLCVVWGCALGQDDGRDDKDVFDDGANPWAALAIVLTFVVAIYAMGAYLHVWQGVF